MASFPQFHSELLYPNNFSDVQSLLMAGGDNGMCGVRNNIDLAGGEETLIPSFDTCAMDDRTVSPDQSDALSSLLTMPYPDLSGSVSDMTVPSLPEFNLGLYGIHSWIGGHPPAAGASEFGDELFGFVPDLKPVYRNSWGSQSNEMHGVEETNIKVASRYSEEERKERIVRYLKKRNQRNFNKTIKYACRKTLADRRTRVRGRFARNNELCDPEMAVKSNQSSPTHNVKQRDQTKKEEEESWLQELAASLMYLPYVTNYSGHGV